MAGRHVMSLEAALEEERQGVEALILQQANRAQSLKGDARSPSPYTTPRSPVRSMLDIGGTDSNSSRVRSPPATQYRSMLDLDSPPAGPVRSMLDVGGRSTPKSGQTSSAQTSPTMSSQRLALANQIDHHRSMSDAASKPEPGFKLRSPPLRERPSDITSAYQFSDIYATNVGQAQPTRRGGPSAPRSSSIGEALRGADLSNLVLPGDNRKPFSLRGNSKSKSPSNRFSLRSSSPHGSLLGNSGNRKSTSNVITDNDGHAIDMSNAYRRLSDANLLYGGSSLASYARKKSEAEGHGRLEKLNMSPYGEILSDDDSDDNDPNTSDEEDERGRKLTTRADRGSDKVAKSLLAAAEDERRSPTPRHGILATILTLPQESILRPSPNTDLFSNQRLQLRVLAENGISLDPNKAYTRPLVLTRSLRRVSSLPTKTRRPRMCLPSRRPKTCSYRLPRSSR